LLAEGSARLAAASGRTPPPTRRRPERARIDRLEGIAVSDRSAKILLLLVTLVVALAGTELVLRAIGQSPAGAAGNRNFDPDSEYGWAQFDPVLGWHSKPGVFLATEPGHAPMTFWSDGRRATRDDPTPLPLPQIALVGCSFTQGYAVVDAETFGYRLSSLASGWDVENFGTGGFGAYQSFLMMKRIFSSSGGRYAPKLVVYGYTNFHAYRDVAGEAWVRTLRKSTGELFAPPSVIVQGGHLVEYPFTLFPLWPAERHSALVAVAKQAYLGLRFRSRLQYAEPVTKALLKEMRNLATEHGARFVVMELTRAPTVVDRYMAEHAISFVSCPDFAPEIDLMSPSYRVGGTGHPNGKVHASWARCIAHWIETHP
jgi:hypothetical protein